MSVTLREITMENFHACISLQLTDEQKGFVASNVYSLAEAKADGISVPLAIYAEDAIVGFVMYWFDEDRHQGHVERLMVDARFQGRGHGRAAMKEVLHRLWSRPDCQAIQTSVAHANVAAESLYASLGFRRTGETVNDGEEAVMLLDHQESHP